MSNGVNPNDIHGNTNSPVGPNHFENLEGRMMLAGNPASADSALAYDAKGNLHVAYYDANTQDLKYTVQSKGGTWSAPVTVDASSKDVGQQVSIALDKNNRPAIAYRDAAKQDLKFARFDGKKWVVSTVDSKNNTGVNPSLAFDKQNNPLISFYRPSAKDLQLATGGGKGWTFTTIATKASAGASSSVAVDPKTGKAAVAFEGNDGKVRYVEKAGKTLSAPVVVESTSKGGGEISLTFGAGGKPTFSYYDPETGEIKLAMKNGKGFKVDSIASVDPGSSDPGAKVVIDPATKKPMVVFYDAANDGLYVANQEGEVMLVAEGGAGNTPVVIDPKSGKIIFTEPSEDGSAPQVHDTRVIPAAPSDVAAEAVSASAVTVAWSDNSDNEAGFLVERSLDGENWTAVATVGANVTSFTDTGLNEGTAYVYRVSAVGPTGLTATAEELGDATTYPAAPTGVTATPLNPNVIVVAWSDNSQGEDGYVIERSDDGGATFEQVAERPAGPGSFTDNTVAEGTTYAYRVIAYNAAGWSVAGTSSATTVVAAPSALSAVSVSAGQVNLTWTNNSNKATGLVIERSADGGATFSQLATLTGSATAFADTTVTAGAQYVYRVKAVGSAGPSTYATSSAAQVISAAPQNLAASAVATTQVNLSWTEVAGAASYVIERSADNGATFAQVGTSAEPAYEDTTVLEGAAYTYRVRAVNTGGASANSATATATTSLAAPSGLTATPVSATQVDLAWADNSSGETGFRVERSSDGGTTWDVLTSVAAGSTSHSDTTALEGCSYLYRVRAYKTIANSDYTATASATTHMLAPTGLTATAVSLTQVDLAWANASSAETGYEIYRSTDGGTTYTLLHTAADDATSYSDTAATEGKTYHYKVRAINAVATSSHTDAESATTKPSAPSSLGGTVVSATRIDLTWADNSSGETGYRVEVSTDGGTTFSTLATLDAGSTGYSHTTGTQGTTYQYRVIAVNAAGDSAASNVVTATTLVAAPSDLAATPTTATNVHLTWTDNATGETGFIVERSTDGGATFSAVSTLLAADATTFDDATASAGTSYVYRVLAVNTASATAASNTANALTLPAAATGVAATVAGPTTVNVAWNAVTGASSYVVERTTDGGATWTQVATPLTNAYADTAATEGGTFAYRVTSVNATGNGNVSADSAPVTTVPAAPTTLTATPVSASQVDLAWADNSSHETGYVIQRSADAGANWTTLHTTAANATSWSDTTTSGATAYQYRVLAAGAGGNSAATDASSVLTVPAAPSAANAIATADTRATVSWSAVTGAAGYTIQRSDDGGTSWSTLTTVGSGTLAHADATAAEGTTYLYRVLATNATGASAASPDASVTTLPAAASNLTKTLVSPTRVDLAWTDNSSGETGYLVERSSNGGTNYTPLIVVAANSTSYSDTTATEGTAYVYRVKPVNITGTGAGVTVSATTAPVAPTSLGLTPVSHNRIDLAWTDNSSRETGFTIERSLDGSTWTAVHTAAASATSWSDTTVSGGTEYHYRVRATGVGTDSANSNAPSTLTAPAPVTDLALTVVSATQINVTWTDVTGEDGYALERSDDGGSTWSTIATPVAGASSYSDTAVLEGVTYAYRLTSSNATDTSGASNTPSATTLPAAATSLTATPTSATNVNLAWTDNSAHETAFVIERSEDGGTTWSTVHTTAADETTWSDTTVTGGTSYTYRVTAKQGAALGAASNTDAALTHPGQVNDLTATPISATQVDLAWTPVTGATNYLIEASTDNGNNWSTITTVGAVATYSHTAAESTAYLYRVTAINATGNGVASADQAATTFSAAPTVLTVTPLTSTSIDLSWTDNSAGETGFVIERSHDGGTSWYVVHTNPAGDDTWTDSTVTGGSTFEYRVFAQNATGDSPAATAAPVTTVPDAVANLTATPVSTTAIDLAWDAASGATGYQVDVSTDGGTTWSPVATLNDSAILTYNATGLTEGSDLVYRVIAFNATGNAAASSAAASTFANGATNLTATPTSNSNVDLAWDDNSTGETGFHVERSSDGGATWSLIHTTAADAVSYSDNGITGGSSVMYRVTAFNEAGDAARSNTPSALTSPDQITGLTVTPTSDTSVEISWNATQGATSYTVRRSTDGGNTWSNIGTTADLTLTDTGRTESTTYTYDVIATNATGDGADSDNDDALTLPAAPSGLTAVGQNTTTINLSWTDNSAGEASYVIERSDDGGATWSPIHTTAANANSWSDTTATEGTAYQYRIHATNASGNSEVSSVATGNSAPAAVSGVGATAVSATEVAVTWTDHSAGESGFVIERSIDGGSTWTTAGTADADATSFADTAAPEGAAIEYRVRAVKGSVESADAPTDSVTTVSATPTALTATASSPTQVDLTWEDNSASETGYEIYRSTDGGTSWTLVHTAAADAESWSDTNAPENSALKYKVLATGAGGNSADSNVADATTALAAPTVLTASAVSDTTVNLAWTDNSSAETGFKIERSTDGGATWTLVHTTAADETTWSDTTGAEDTTYTYRVTATDGVVDSLASNTDAAKTALTAPAITGVASNTATSVTLTWSDNSGAETGYQIERSDDGGSTWNLVHTTAADATTWTDTSVAEGTQYQYRVRAAGAGNFSDYTAVSTLTTIPATPTTVTASPFSTTQIDLSWADNSASETGYVIERSSDGGNTWSDIHTTAANATNWSDSTVTEASDYQYRVRATGAGGNSATSDPASATSIPNAPTTLTSAVASATQVNLTWVDNSNGEANYVIERSTDNGVSFSTLTTVAAGSTSYSDTAAAEASSYVYRVRAIRGSVVSAWSNASVQVTTLPAAATDLAVATPTNTRAVLTWTDNSSGETGFKVYRSTDAGATWTLINTTLANATTYSDNTVTEGGSYAYRVVSFNATGDGVSTDPVTVTTVPASPSALSGSAANPTRIDLSWTDRSGAETGFKIERSTNGGSTWTEIAVLGANETSFSDTTVTEGTNYQYKVRAYGPGGNSGYTGSVSVTTQLLAPTGLTATTVSATRVDLAWTDNSTKESQFKVERSADGGSTWSVIATLAANATTYSDTTVTEGTSYLYKVRAARTGNTSAYTSNAAATTLPAAPSGLNAVVASATQVNLTWTDNSSGETGFVVERSSDGGNTWTQIATPSADATSYNDTTATEGTAYTYRVKAVNAGGSSAFATSSPVTTLPAAPTALVATSPLADTVELTWTDNSASESGFKVERSDDGGSTWTQIATTLAGVTTYADTTVEEGTEYQYRVRANIGGANSAYSNTQTVTTVPLMPADLVATTVSQTRVDLAWTDLSGGETSYKIERSDDGGLTFSEIDSVAGNSTSYSDTTASEGIAYQYRIRAANAGGYSGYSSSAEALTLPAAPTGLTAEAVAADEVLVTWTDTSVGEEGFYLERESDEDPGNWVLIATLSPDANSHSDTTVSTGHTYTYRVRAFNAAGDSANSATDSATTP